MTRSSRAPRPETLRFDPPVQRTGRVSFDDTEVAGREVSAGQWVNVLIGGANRDPAVFGDPATSTSPQRRRRPPGFSSGIHHCVGRPLAELEATVALQVLAGRCRGCAGPAPHDAATRA